MKKISTYLTLASLYASVIVGTTPFAHAQVIVDPSSTGSFNNTTQSSDDQKITAPNIFINRTVDSNGVPAPVTNTGGNTSGSSGGNTSGESGGNSNKKVSSLATLPNPLKVKSISELFYDVVDFALSLSYVVIAFFFLLSGFKFVTAQGSDDKTTDAKRMFFNTVIGAAVIIGANTIVAVVKSIVTSLQK